ncbi:hypothetical protein IEI94_01685 [Halomonas sp. ML-15]|uniref:alpha/beta fold hydrolase n=1 Tax=Halomonas sp. ML-15 TaxID=2773305 RepID=UPI00174781D5|nr:hypothetical protein [Halomonas sp. ML-15]MBD3894567.1 hypothetical protein [Halomonas sp. ML-15]
MYPTSLSRPALLLATSLLSGCATTSPSEYATQGAEQQLAAAGLDEADIGDASLMRAWYRETPEETPASWHIYVEGDGRAWQVGGRPASNPTPSKPVAMQLALDDEHSHVAYLARPCQFLQPLPDGCHFSLWTHQRYGPAVEAQLLDALNEIADGATVRIIGFSGGAHLAQQLAHLYPKVEMLISVAGNLDDASFAQHHRLPAPANGSPLPSATPFYSLAGGNDDIVPPSLAQHQLDRQARGCHRLEIQPGAQHSGPWQLDWQAIETFFAACQELDAPS